MSAARGTLRYKRSRFATRLPTDCRFTRSHFWLRPIEPGGWRVGMTSFATRMLGDLVECSFVLAPSNHVELGQVIGSIEGFKAVSDLYAVASGTFVGPNDDLARDVTLIESSPYDRGWLYAVEGEPDPASLDVHGYVDVLDATIDRMLASRRADAEPPDDSAT